MRKKANAKINIEYHSQRNGLKVYGKKQNVPVIKPGDIGFCEPIGNMMKDLHQDKTHHFYPAKWGYTWSFLVNENEFSML